MGAEGGKAGWAGEAGWGDPEGPNTGRVGAYLTGSALKARPCHIHPQTWPAPGRFVG